MCWWMERKFYNLEINVIHIWLNNVIKRIFNGNLAASSMARARFTYSVCTQEGKSINAPSCSNFTYHSMLLSVLHIIRYDYVACICPQHISFYYVLVKCYVAPKNAWLIQNSCCWWDIYFSQSSSIYIFFENRNYTLMHKKLIFALFIYFFFLLLTLLCFFLVHRFLYFNQFSCNHHFTII